jgi:hypothetical protein
MRALAPVGLALSILALAAAGRAEDTVAGTRSTSLRERSHTVSAVVRDGFATLTARRVLHNGGDRHDQALVWMALPEGAAAIGLRTLGAIGGKPRWFAADLLDAVVAAARYRELTGLGGFTPKDPALLSWRRQGELVLQVFPVAPGDDKTVEVTLVVPTTYGGGRDVLRLPYLGTSDLAAELTVSRGDGPGAVFSGARAIAPGTRLTVATGGAEVAIARGPRPPLGGGLAVVPLPTGRALVRRRIEAAPRLGEAPAGASVVVVIDASRSQDEAAVADEVAAARATLAHLPGARVLTLLFARRVTALSGGFVGVDAARAALASASIARGNGSALDAALERAAVELRGAPPGSAKRILVFTDAETRSSLAPAVLGAIARRSGALVHVAVVAAHAAHGARLARDDDHALASATRPTGGLVWSAAASDEPGDAVAMHAAYEELARPLRVDRLIVRAGARELDLLDHLDEGEGLEAFTLDASPPRALRVTGELWARPVAATLAPTDDEARLASALAFGSSLLGHLDEAERRALAWRGHAVSPVTSLLAIEPGVRPSTEGLEDGAVGEGIGLGVAGPLGSGAAGGHGQPVVDADAIVRGLVAAAAAACPAAGHGARVAVESTRDEIVDVGRAEAVDAATARCVEEAAWSVVLPDAMRAVGRREVLVAL